MRKKPKAPKLVTVAIFTTITIVFWIFFSLYNILIQPAELEVDKALLEPLEPTLDVATLNTLNNRKFYEEGEVVVPIIIIEISPTPSPSPSPTPTGQEEEIPLEEETQTATPEAIVTQTQPLP